MPVEVWGGGGGGGSALFAGTNITLSTSANSVTIIGNTNSGATTFLAGISTDGNTSGTTGFVNNQMKFIGGNNITLSQSINAQSATLTISAGNGVDTFGMSNIGNTSGTTGVATGSAVQFVLAGGNNVTLSQSINGSSGTITISAFTQTVQTQNLVDVTLAGNTSGALALVSSGTMTLAGGANITLSQAGNAITISGAAGGAGGTGPQVTLAGNTAGVLALISSGTMTLAGGNNITLSQNGNAVTISAPSGGGLGVSTGGNTSGTTGTVDFQMVFAGGNNVTLSQSLNGSSGTITISAANASVQPEGTQTIGMSNLGNTSGTTGVATGTGIQFVFAGGNSITLSQSLNGSSGTITISGPSGGGAGMSNLGNTAGTSGTVGAQLVFVGTNDISLSQSTAAGGSGTLSIFGPGLRSKFYFFPEGAITSGQQVNTQASFQFLEIPYPISFSRIDIPIIVSLASSATANTGNILISSGLVIYTHSQNGTLNPITGSFGTTTHTFASNTANFNNVSGPRMASFALATSLSAGPYYIGFQLSTNNNSSIGTATTQLANTVSVILGASYSASIFNDLGSATNVTTNLVMGRGMQGATITATNQTIPFANINEGTASGSGANFPVLFRNIS